MSTLWTIAANPRKRRARKNPKRARSAAQRAATARMLAANRAKRGGTSKRRARRRVSRVRSVVTRARSSVRRSARRARRSAGRSLSMRGIGGGAMSLLKTGAVGAGGALAVDVAMGFANGFLPASMATKLNADGTPNYLNAAAKFAVTLGVRALASKVVSADTANRMAAGAVTVQTYELLRPFVQSVLPASMSLGWFSPGMTFAAGRRPGIGVGQYQNLGVYQNMRSVVPIRSPNATPGNTRRA